jgi:hypothetical protein
VNYRILIPVVAVFVSLAAADQPDEHAFSKIFEHYEAIRQELIRESIRGVPAHAEAIRQTATELQLDFSAKAAGIASAEAAALRELLPEIIVGAGSLAKVKDLAAARIALAELTKPLTRYQRLVVGPRPVVAYCPMEKKAWLQPDEAIGNPYAPYMLRCGEIVQR